MENVTFENVQDLLNGGKKPKEVFEWCEKFYEGFGCVELNDKYNFIDDNGKILSPNQWFEDCGRFSEGFAYVKINGKRNFIDVNGKLLSPNQWFDDCGLFNEGLAWVSLNGKYFYIDRNGNLYDKNRKPLKQNINMENVTFENAQELLDKGKKPKEVFDYCEKFYEGFACVELNRKWNYIDKYGKIAFPNQWFEDCGRFSEGFACVKINGKWNYIDKYGKIVFPNQWFDYCWSFNEGLARVRLNGKPNYIDRNGNLYDKNKVSLEQQKDKETTENKKRIYIVLSDKEYIDSFDNPYDAMVCVVQKQNTGEIEVVEKVF
jgi:hypothetical protein